MELHRLLHYHEVADSNGTFALYVCAMEKIPSGNTDAAFVSNCDNIQLKTLAVKSLANNDCRKFGGEKTLAN